MELYYKHFSKPNDFHWLYNTKARIKTKNRAHLGYQSTKYAKRSITYH